MIIMKGVQEEEEQASSTGAEDLLLSSSTESDQDDNDVHDNDKADDDDQEEVVEKLLQDTFTFFMTGRYPFEDSFCSSCLNNNKKKNITKDEEEEEEEDLKDQLEEAVDDEEELLTASAGKKSSTRSATTKTEACNEESESSSSFFLDSFRSYYLRRKTIFVKGAQGQDPTVLPKALEEDDDEESLTSDQQDSRPTSSNKVKTKARHKEKETSYGPFLLGCVVFIIQCSIYTIVIRETYKGRIPPNADSNLRVAQVLAVLVTVYTQSDFIDGVFLVTERWKAFKDITVPIKFNVSAILRVVTGITGIAATFILVVWSEEVVELLLNFTAMEFIATLDNGAFELAVRGFLGGGLERMAGTVRAFRFHPHRRKQRRRSRLFAYLAFAIVIFYIYCVVVYLQSRRLVGIQNEVYIQFDDTGIPELYGISGVYHGCLGFRTKSTGDIGYIHANLPCPNLSKNELPARSFVYCFDKEINGSEGWVYLPTSTTTPCKSDKFQMRSFLDDDPLPQDAYDILTHAKATWVDARPDIGIEAAVGDFVIEAVETIPSRFGYCDGRGLVRNDKDRNLKNELEPLEITDETYYPRFEMNRHSPLDGKLYPEAFGLIYRPLFILGVTKTSFKVILFDGLRWNRIYLNPLQFAHNVSKVDECDLTADPNCWIVFVKYFHSETTPWRSNSTVVFFDGISDPMMILSTTDTGVPTENLQWYESRLDGDRVLPGKPITNNFGFECLEARQDVMESTIDCANDETVLRIYFDTDSFPEDSNIIAFFGQGKEDIKHLTFANRTFVEPGGSEFEIPENGLVDIFFHSENKQHLLQACVPRSECVQVIVADSNGDGLQGVTDYDLSYGEDDPVGGGGSFECRLYSFGPNCTSKPRDCDIEKVIEFFPKNLEAVSVEIASRPTVQDFLRNSFELSCSEDERPLEIEVTTDLFPEETLFAAFFGRSLGDTVGLRRTNEIVITDTASQFEMSGDALTLFSFPFGTTSYLYGTCVPAAECIQVIALDSGNNGFANGDSGDNIGGRFAITYSNSIPVGAGDFDWGGCRSYQFGTGCTNVMDSTFAECNFTGVADILS